MWYAVAKRTMAIGNSIHINRFAWRYLNILFDKKSILINFIWICNLYPFSGSKHTPHLDLPIRTKNNFRLFANLSPILLYTLINLFWWTTSFSIWLFNLLLVFLNYVRMCRFWSLLRRYFFRNWILVGYLSSYFWFQIYFF